MTLFLDPRFWITTAIVGFILRGLRKPSARELFYSISNLLSIYFFLGGSSLLAIIIYASIFALVSYLGTRGGLSKGSGMLLLAIPFFSDRLFSNQLSVVYLGSVAYVFLRSIDLLHSPVLNTKLNWRLPLIASGYLMPLHMAVAGPIAPATSFYKQFQQDLAEFDFDSCLEIIRTISTGFFYKCFCAEGTRLLFFGHQPLHTTSVWTTAILLLYTFFDFAGYSLIALGAGQSAGIYTPQNFDRPFSAASVTEFYNRWHMTLGTFIQRNIYFRLQFSRMERNYLPYVLENVLIQNAFITGLSFAFVGLWHGFNQEFLIWGLTLGAVISFEKVVLKAIMAQGWHRNHTLRNLWKMFGPLYVFAAVTVVIHPCMNSMLRS